MDNVNYSKDKDGNEVYVGLGKQPPRIDYLKMHREKRLPKINQETLLCETQLLVLGNFFPLKGLQIDSKRFNKEIEAYKNEWVPYLPRKGRPNNRQGLCLTSIKGDSHKDGLSMPEARQRHNRELYESDFSSPPSCIVT